MRVAFRVDASPAIGSGHLYRCLTLASYLAQHSGAECHFLVRATDQAITALIERQGHRLHILPGRPLPVDRDLGDNYDAWLGVPWEDDAAVSRAALTAIDKVDWLCIDHYALDAGWEAKVRSMARQVLVIDDLANRPHIADKLLDQNQVPGLLDRYNGLIPDTTQRLLGPTYALLRPEFGYWRERRGDRKNECARHVLVFYGSSDNANLTMKTLQAIEESRQVDLRIDVVVGATNPHLAVIQAMAARIGNVDIHGPGTNMAQLMARADLAFGAAGTTSWERCCLGLPSLIVVLAGNQQAIAAGTDAAGAAVSMGDARHLSPTQISAFFQNLIGNKKRLSEMSRAGMKLVDSMGCARVGALMSCPPSR